MTAGQNEESTRIATVIAAFVEDGATLQVGLGSVLNALFSLLHDRRGLKLHSGMLSDGVMALSESGALEPAFAPTCCVWVGTRTLRLASGPRRHERARPRSHARSGSSR